MSGPVGQVDPFIPFVPFVPFHGNSSSVTWTGFQAIHPPLADKMISVSSNDYHDETTDE
jgi:hypothetical protein